MKRHDPVAETAFPLWWGGDYAPQKLVSVLGGIAFDHGLEIEPPPIKRKVSDGWH